MTRRTLRPWILVLALVGVVAVLAYKFAPLYDDAGIFRPIDFMEYQTAGRATLAGQNPYDGAVLYPYQLEIQAKLLPSFKVGPGNGGQYDDPIMMWNPPWTLPLTIPLGMMHWRLGQLLWTVAQMLSVVVSGVMLWRLFGGVKEKTPVAVGVALLFAPTLFLLLLGQISGFLLLGLVGFLWYTVPHTSQGEGCLGANSPTPTQNVSSLWVAGLFLSLTAIKPHLLLPFALVLGLETLRGGRAWRTVIAGVLTLVVFGLIPMTWNPHVWSQYFEGTAAQSAGTHNTPSDWMHPTLGYWLRTLHPARPMSLMFVPLLVAVPVVVGYWWMRRKAWDWRTELPRLVLVSLLTAPYGAWGFDLVLLLIPVVHVAVWVARDPRKWVQFTFLGGFVAINLLALFSLRFENSMANGWLTPAVAVGYLLASWVTGTRTITATESRQVLTEQTSLPAAVQQETVPS